MAARRSQEVLRAFLRVGSLVMIFAGSATVFFGLASLPVGPPNVAVIDSELRFYAVWYVLSGLMLWRAAADLQERGWMIRLILSAFFVAGCARGVSWLWLGRPHSSQVTLMVIELVLPVVVIPWHVRCVRRNHQPRPASSRWRAIKSELR